jgi:hypothetical protein
MLPVNVFLFADEFLTMFPQTGSMVEFWAFRK